MIVNLVYFGIGILFGLAVKYEVDTRMKKRKIARKIGYLKSVATRAKLQDCDDLLSQIRHVNESLSSLNKKRTKEGVR